MSTLFFVRSHDLPEVAWRLAVHLRCATTRRHSDGGHRVLPEHGRRQIVRLCPYPRSSAHARGGDLCPLAVVVGGVGGASCAPGAGAAPHRRRSSTEPLRGADRRGRNRLQLPAVVGIEATFKRWAGQIANQSLPFLNMSYRFDMRKTTNR